MKIAAIETIPVRVPIKPDLMIRAKAGAHSESPFLLVKMRTDDGLLGLGEVSCTPRWSGEDQFTAAHFIDTILAARSRWNAIVLANRQVAPSKRTATAWKAVRYRLGRADEREPHGRVQSRKPDCAWGEMPPSWSEGRDNKTSARSRSGL